MSEVKIQDQQHSPIDTATVVSADNSIDTLPVTKIPDPIEATREALTGTGAEITGENTMHNDPENQVVDSAQFQPKKVEGANNPEPKKKIPKIGGTEFAGYHYIKRAMEKLVLKRRQTKSTSQPEPISISKPVAVENSEEPREELPNAA